MMESGILAVLKPDHFDCDSPPEQAVLSKKHFTHSAAAEFCFNDKTIDAAAREIADSCRLLHGTCRRTNCMPATDCVAAGQRAMSLLPARWRLRESVKLWVLGNR